MLTTQHQLCLTETKQNKIQSGVFWVGVMILYLDQHKVDEEPTVAGIQAQVVTS